MKPVVGFLGGCFFGIAISAIAVETSDIGRYQVSTSFDGDGLRDYQTIIDTETGQVISRQAVHYSAFKRVKK